MQILKDIWAYIKIFTPLMNYRYRKYLDDIFLEILNNKASIQKIHYTSHETIITMPTYSIKCWTANKYYGYLSTGVVYNNDNQIVCAWTDSRPSRYIMLKIEELFEAWYFK